MEGRRKERKADGESERGSAGLAGLIRSATGRSQRACRRKGVARRAGSGRDRQDLGSEAWAARHADLLPNSESPCFCARMSIEIVLPLI